MTAPNARAFWVTEPGHAEIRESQLPPPQPGEVRVRTLYSGISRGTESLVFHGEVPESEWNRMRAPFQEGGFPGPVKYGYASVGVVEDGTPALRGQAVFCLYPHQTAYNVPAEAVVPLPDGVPAERAVLAANAETAVNALWDAGPRVGDRIAVVGAGTVGCLVAGLAAAIPATRVQLIDVNPEKAGAANALGIPFASPDKAEGEADLVIHTSGHADGLRDALALAGFEATVLELSWYGTRDVPLPLGREFHAKRLTLASSQVGSVSPVRRARWTHRRRLELALEVLRDARFDALITGESRFEDLPNAIARLAREPGGTLCHRIVYAQEP
ncbi:zinc-dependent alcohol dehydrogenase [Ferruginivarius sediminum]|uniref:Dehydrogenase n=1 Tax=Ferruginivarius sediminum TaxID=2661937 RepID=A0A369T7T7_9PROT|nr:zinc-binding alcohol dehydrogenase [Ferruginivarius sediminum]RDD61383.1 dehydrogenase [Ferruginivarius sediminum]